MPAIEPVSLLGPNPPNTGGLLGSGSRKARDFYVDGDFTTAQPCAAPVPTYPFLNQGDTETVIYRWKHEQFVRNYQPLSLTKPMRGVPNAYPLGDVNFRDGGCSIWEFERTFGNIPKQCIRHGQSHTYAFQYILSSGAGYSGAGEGGDISNLVIEGATYTIGTRPSNVNSTLQYDYFLAGKEGNFPLKLAPRVEQIGTRITVRGVDINDGPFPLYLASGGDSGCICAVGGKTILAEDDVYDDWLGAIRCRVRRTITGATPLFWSRSGI